jgi:hypothetical protein
MHLGTLIRDLFAAVERAEENVYVLARARRKELQSEACSQLKLESNSDTLDSQRSPAG